MMWAIPTHLRGLSKALRGIGYQDGLHWHRVLDVEILKYSLQVAHESCTAHPASAPILPVGSIFTKRTGEGSMKEMSEKWSIRLTLHSNNEMNSILVFHLIDIDT